jgi:hypothetical protein
MAADGQEPPHFWGSLFFREMFGTELASVELGGQSARWTSEIHLSQEGI